MPVRNKIKEWIYRYGPAEIISLLLTVGGAWAVFEATHKQVAAAFAATWAGNIGFFGTIFLRDIWQLRKTLHADGKPYTVHDFWLNVRAMVIEFGVAEVLDSFLIRPALMYWMPVWLGNLTAGVIAAKFVADVTFYIPAVFFYEWNKKKR